MARVGLGIGIRGVAKLANVSPSTVARFEAGEELLARTVETIQTAFEKSGVQFTNGDAPGVKLHSKPSKASRKF
jgi:hypothetical protein